MSIHLGGTDLSVVLPDGTPLFSDLQIALGAERTGLVGRNGIGKSTLIRVLAGRRAPTGGTVLASGRVSVLEQRPDLPPGAPVARALGVAAALHAHVRVLAGAGTPADLDLLDGLWDLPERVERALLAAGIPHLAPGSPFDALSGGEQTRVQIARLLLEEPDFVLLDEPTNHLDRDARAFVREWVRGWRKGMLVVSHDRVLLEEMDRIALLDERGLHLYGGGFSFYEASVAREREAAEQALQHSRKALDEAREQARRVKERQAHRQADGRRRVARTGIAPMAAGIMKRNAEGTAARLGDRHAERVEGARAAVARARESLVPSHSIAVDLAHTAVPDRKRILDLREVNHRYPGAARAVWDEPLSLSIVGPERIALSGPNGSGKSTLLGIAAGSVVPVEGSRRLGAARTAELDQQARVLAPGLSLLDNLRSAAPSRPEEELRLVLARFLFDEAAVRRPAGVLSGGERMRAALACLLCREKAPELLLLDEPTNHLDLDSAAEVASVVAQYRGALIVVSHDEAFVRDVGVTRTVTLTRRPEGRHPLP